MPSFPDTSKRSPNILKECGMAGYKVRKGAKIRNQYNQVPYLTYDTTWESEKNTIKHHMQKSKEVIHLRSCFLPGTLQGKILNVYIYMLIFLGMPIENHFFIFLKFVTFSYCYRPVY